MLRVQIGSLDDRNFPQWLRGKCPEIQPLSTGQQQELEKAQYLVLDMQAQDASMSAASN